MSEHRILLVENPAKLSIEHGQLKVSVNNENSYIAPRDIALLFLHHPAISLSHAVLNELAEAGALIISTNKRHMPSATLLPEAGHGKVVSRLFDQISVHRKALSRQLWKQLVQNRLNGQAWVLYRSGLPGSVALLRLASKVRSGDSANVESQGARKYWQELYQVTGRRREKQGANDPVNSRLNFGYTIVRSLVARSLVAAGLQPALGVGHHSTENALNLADDFIEPYRCLVERFVVSHLSNEPLTSIVKKELAELISEQVKMNGQEYRLPSAIMETVNSYVRILERGEGRLSLPDWPLEG